MNAPEQTIGSRRKAASESQLDLWDSGGEGDLRVASADAVPPVDSDGVRSNARTVWRWRHFHTFGRVNRTRNARWMPGSSDLVGLSTGAAPSGAANRGRPEHHAATCSSVAAKRFL